MSSAFIIDSDFLFGTNVRTGFGAHRRLTFLLRTSGFEDLPLSPRKPIPQHGVRGRRRLLSRRSLGGGGCFPLITNN